MHPLGQTRTSVQPNHAFIAPDGHVPADLPDWTNTQGIIIISPHMMRSPRFTQYLALMGAGGKSGAPLPDVQRFLYSIEGTVQVTIDAQTTTVDAGHFAYIPANIPHSMTTTDGAKVLIFEKPYVPSRFTGDRPQVHIGDAWAGDGEPFLGDEDARMRLLLPTDLPYDMAINLFSFKAGAALPFVETHIMEHGMMLLEGQGIYRLDDKWYPIQVGDSIWMGSYCPQWFCAIGKTQSTYIYYKDVNRDPLG